MLPSRFFFIVSAVVLLAMALSPTTAGDPAAEKKDKVNDKVELAAGWLYDDLPAALARAKKENKPVLAAFR
ncbi:MAG: hypothetical protein AAB074_06900 [Planctomycetota bacterium]